MWCGRYDEKLVGAYEVKSAGNSDRVRESRKEARHGIGTVLVVEAHLVANRIAKVVVDDAAQEGVARGARVLVTNDVTAQVFLLGQAPCENARTIANRRGLSRPEAEARATLATELPAPIISLPSACECTFDAKSVGAIRETNQVFRASPFHAAQHEGVARVVAWKAVVGASMDQPIPSSLFPPPDEYRRLIEG
jgi:hypothetical protein